MQDVLMCVQMGKTIDDPNRMKFPSDEFYIKTYDEMAKAFPDDLDALATTLEIAEKCNYSLKKIILMKINICSHHLCHQMDYRSLIICGNL